MLIVISIQFFTYFSFASILNETWKVQAVRESTDEPLRQHSTTVLNLIAEFDLIKDQTAQFLNECTAFTMLSFNVQCLDIIQDSLEDCVVLELFGDVINLRDAKEEIQSTGLITDTFGTLYTKKINQNVSNPVPFYNLPIFWYLIAGMVWLILVIRIISLVRDCKKDSSNNIKSAQNINGIEASRRFIIHQAHDRNIAEKYEESSLSRAHRRYHPYSPIQNPRKSTYLSLMEEEGLYIGTPQSRHRSRDNRSISQDGRKATDLCSDKSPQIECKPRHRDEENEGISAVADVAPHSIL